MAWSEVGEPVTTALGVLVLGRLVPLVVAVVVVGLLQCGLLVVVAIGPVWASCAALNCAGSCWCMAHVCHGIWQLQCHCLAARLRLQLLHHSRWCRRLWWKVVVGRVCGHLGQVKEALRLCGGTGGGAWLAPWSVEGLGGVGW